MPALFLLPLLTLTSFAAEPEERALAYLAREVPRWAVENKCYSCHNNGDAARALYRGLSLKYAIPERVLADTTEWLSQPDKWDKNGGDGPFNDKDLARLQFTSALGAAFDAAQVKDRALLTKTAKLLAAQQLKDGSWSAGTVSGVGGSITYGTALATRQACVILRRAGKEFDRALEKADGWFRKVEVKTVLDAAAVLWALGDAKDAPAVAQQEHCLTLIRKGESKEAGWGPYVSSAPEVFDTALVTLALAARTPSAEAKAMIKRGREYLLKEQKADGSWQETTRPGGAESYPNRLSTSGWATLALLETRPAK